MQVAVEVAKLEQMCVDMRKDLMGRHVLTYADVC
jgi:hypothetical protein